MKTNLKSQSIKLIPVGSRSPIWGGWRFKAFLLILALVLLSLPPPSASIIHAISSPGSLDPSGWLPDPEVTPTAAAAVAVGSFDFPQSFIVRGTGTFSVAGVDIRGRFETAYFVGTDGRVTIRQLRAEVDPAGVLIFRVPILRDRRVPLFCASAVNVGPINGVVDPTGKLTIPSGAATVLGSTFSEPGPFPRGCPGRGAVSFFSATNNDSLTGRHDPARDEFRLEGEFPFGDFNITIRMMGNYVNRPPRAIIGVAGPGLSPTLVQGGCPPLSGINPPTTEANDPEGLRVILASASFDPDGAWGRADIFLEQWSHARAGGPFELLGQGPRIGPVLFEFGTQHRLLLSVTDRAGAISRDSCGFIVVDTTPPLVLPPSRITLLCTERGGASARTSRALREFLIGARTSDNSDPAPMPLPPQVDGMDVTEKTLFPLDRGQHPQPCFTPVVFRFQDRHGNIGAAISGVRVVDRRPPDLSVDLFPNLLQPTFEFVTIRADILTADVCGGVSVILDAIVADPPPPPQSDLVLIRGAEFGTDDREFQLRAAPAIGPNQQPVDRIYKVTYLSLDDLGNETRATARVIVKAM